MSRLGGLALLLGLMLAGCVQREWVQTKPEPEGYPFESARKICDNYARDKATIEHPDATGWPSPRTEELDMALYQRLYTRCMEHYGWVLQTRPREPKPQEPDKPEAEQADKDKTAKDN
jgi:hypothetical protein